MFGTMYPKAPETTYGYQQNQSKRSARPKTMLHDFAA